MERMNYPDQGDDQGQGRGLAPESLRDDGYFQRSSDYSEQCQGGQDMHADIECMVALYVQPTNGVVDGQGQIDDGPSLDSLALSGRREHFFYIPQPPDSRIFDNTRLIVKDERPTEAIVIGQQTGDDNYSSSNQGPPV